MRREPEYDLPAMELLLAGQRVLPGLYREVETGRLVLMEKEDRLPASLDGRVACYIRSTNTWEQISAHSQQKFRNG